MICTRSAENYKDAGYKREQSGKFKELSYSEAMVELEKKFSQEYPTYEERDQHLKEICNIRRTQEEEPAKNTPVQVGEKNESGKQMSGADVWNSEDCPAATPQLSRRAAELLSRVFKCQTTTANIHTWYCRTDSKGYCFEQCANPYHGLSLGGLHSKGTAEKVEYILNSLYLGRILFEYVIPVVDMDKIGNAQILSSDEFAAFALSEVQKSMKGMSIVFQEGCLNHLMNIAASLPLYPKEKPLTLSSGFKKRLPILKNILKDPSEANGVLSEMFTSEKEMELVEDLPIITDNPKTPAYHYVDATTFSDGPTPSFDSFISRMEGNTWMSFMGCVGAAFVPDASHRQACWIRSGGYDGKSSFFRALARYCGSMMVSTSGANIKDSFGKEILIGKRIVCFNDTDNVRLLQTGVLKNITGADDVTINRKFRTEIQHTFNLCVFITANDPAQIATTESQMTRILYVNILKATEEQMKNFCKVDDKGNLIFKDGKPIKIGSDFSGKLYAEMPHIIFKCIEMYKKLAPNNREMELPDGVEKIMLRDCSSSDESRFSLFLNQHTVLGSECSQSWIEFSDELIYKFLEMSKSNIKESDYMRSSFGRYLESKFDCQIGKFGKVKATDIDEVEVIKGIRLKTKAEVDGRVNSGAVGLPKSNELNVIPQNNDNI